MSVLTANLDKIFNDSILTD